jgi:predicted MFS family arabinose efflux permease
VGVGEAGFTAVAQSVIADYHTPAERTRAMSIFMLGVPLGVCVTYLVGGWVNEAWGWRMAFVLAGAPGLILALLLKWTVAEPSRGLLAPTTAHEPAPPLRSVFVTLWRRRALRHLTAALTVFYFMAGALGTWTVPFFIRTHGMSTGELGTWLAFTGGLGGVIGVWLSGRVFTWFNMEDPRAQIRLVALLAAVAWLTQMSILLWPTKMGALLLVGVHNVLTQFFFAPSYALMQSLCAPRMRATMISISVLSQSLAGSILGIQLMGVLSDVLTPHFGDQALRLGMLALTPMFLWIAGHFWLASRSVRADLAEALEDTTSTQDNVNNVRTAEAL